MQFAPIPVWSLVEKRLSLWLVSSYRNRMKRFLPYILAAAICLFFLSTASAQTISLGERTPRLKKAKWLNGNQPQKSDLTYIEFIHSASLPCRKSAERIYGIIKEFNNIAFILISHQSATEIDEWVTHHINERAGVIVDDTHIRTSFGVNYAPYAVILDHKHRALWFGNPQLLNREAIEKLVTNSRQ